MVLPSFLRSFGNKVFSIEELGILNTPKTNALKLDRTNIKKNKLKTILSTFFK